MIICCPYPQLPFLREPRTQGYKLLRLENVKLFSRQDKILYILDTTILILYRKLYINIVSIIVLKIEAIRRLILLYRAALFSEKEDYVNFIYFYSSH